MKAVFIVLVQEHNKSHILMIYVVLALATVIAFEPVRHNDFVDYDDLDYVVENPHVNGGITRESVLWAFTTPYASNWHPLTWLSHMLDCQFFGLKPLWHHLTNLLFHIATTLLLFWVLKRMTGAVWCSAFVASAFALHPLHVESVAWLSERKDVLSGFFWMLTIAAYIRHAGRPGTVRYLLVILALCLGLMAKSMLVTLPFVLLLLDYWPLGRLQWLQQGRQKALLQPKSRKVSYPKWGGARLIVEKIPLLALVMVSSAITFIVQSGAAMRPGENLPVNTRIANALVSYVSYIGKMIYPSRLALSYPYPVDGWPVWQSMACFVILAGITTVVIYTARRRRYLAVGWLWYLGTLVPVIGLVQVGSQAMADRYTYLPSIGLFIMVAWGAAELGANRRFRKIGLGISAGLVLVVLLIYTRIQVRYWQNALTLFGHAVEVTENNYVMHGYYGGVLLEKGRIEEADSHIRRSLQLNPRNLIALDNMSELFFKKEMFNEAVVCLNRVLQLKPDHVKAINNLGSALKKQGKTNEAIKEWKKALEIEPDYPDAHYNLGLAMTRQGKCEQACKHFNASLLARPRWLKAYHGLAAALKKQGKTDESIEKWESALEIEPDYHDAHLNLGAIYHGRGRFALAVSHWTKLVELQPDSAEVLNNLAWILATTEDSEMHNPTDAVKFARRACELTGYNRPEFLDTLAVAYASAANFPEAAKVAEKAVNLARCAAKDKLAKEIQGRLELYKTGQPYREK